MACLLQFRGFGGWTNSALRVISARIIMKNWQFLSACEYLRKLYTRQDKPEIGILGDSFKSVFYSRYLGKIPILRSSFFWKRVGKYNQLDIHPENYHGTWKSYKIITLKRQSIFRTSLLSSMLVLIGVPEMFSYIWLNLLTSYHGKTVVSKGGMCQANQLIAYNQFLGINGWLEDH